MHAACFTIWPSGQSALTYITSNKNSIGLDVGSDWSNSSKTGGSEDSKILASGCEMLRGYANPDEG